MPGGSVSSIFDALATALELLMGAGAVWIAWLAVEDFIERRNERRALAGSKKGECK